MTSTADDPKTELQAALLNQLESGVPLNKIRVAPLCSEFQLSCGKDKAAKLYEKILKESGVEQFFIEYLKGELDGEVISEMASRKQSSPPRKPRRKAQAPEHQQGKEKTAMPDSRGDQTPPVEATRPRELFVVGEKGNPRVASKPASSDMKGRTSGPDRGPADLQSIPPGSSLTRRNDNGSSLDEAMADMTDAFHIFVTEEPSLSDVKAVTRYLQSATRLAHARVAS